MIPSINARIVKNVVITMLNTSMFLSRRSLILEISHWIDDFSLLFILLDRLDNWNKSIEQIARHPIESMIAITFWSLFNFVLF